MRTLVILPGGFAPCSSCRGPASGDAASLTSATIGFAALWFALAAANPWVGVARTGYYFREELPVFLMILLMKTLVAVGVRREFL